MQVVLEEDWVNVDGIRVTPLHGRQPAVKRARRSQIVAVVMQATPELRACAVTGRDRSSRESRRMGVVRLMARGPAW